MIIPFDEMFNPFKEKESSKEEIYKQDPEEKDSGKLGSNRPNSNQPKPRSNETNRDFQLSTLNETQTAVNLDVNVEKISSLQIIESESNSAQSISSTGTGTEESVVEDQGKIDFLESKVALLELLLEAQTIKINEQAEELANLKISRDEEKVTKSDIMLTETCSMKDINSLVDEGSMEKERIRSMKESMELDEARLIAASFIHAESLYLNKLDQLEYQIARERMKVNDSRLFPVSGAVPVEKLEQTLVELQKLLNLEPNISAQGLDLLLKVR